VNIEARQVGWAKNAERFSIGATTTCAIAGKMSRTKFLMATLAERLSTNAPGPYYVDGTCIDCDQCRAMAPDFFGRDAESGFSYVQRQPATGEEIALVEEVASQCATASIGNDGV
jgi:ferredoxin